MAAAGPDSIQPSFQVSIRTTPNLKHGCIVLGIGIEQFGGLKGAMLYILRKRESLPAFPPNLCRKP